MYGTVLFKALTQAKTATPKSWQQYINLTKQQQRVR
jgi:hypothetical protein